MADFKHYDPGRVTAVFKTIPILGYMDGTMISGDRSEDTWELVLGAQGDGARVRKRNKSGIVEFTLQQTAPTNAKLAAMALQDEQFQTGVGPLFVKDLNGNDLMVAENAWIIKPPTMDMADTLSPRVWRIACHELELYAGGALL